MPTWTHIGRRSIPAAPIADVAVLLGSLPVDSPVFINSDWPDGTRRDLSSKN
jgi:hypothetical protein